MANMQSSHVVAGLNILNSTLAADNNSVEVQVGDVVNEEVESFTAQWVQQVGFCSLPPNAVPNKKAPEAVIIKYSNRDYVIASRDVASQANYGQLLPGECCLYACGADGGAQARVMCKGDGSISLYTTDNNQASGNGVYLQVAPNGLFFMSPWGKMVFDATGFHIKTASGASLDLGGLNFPGPLSAMGSYARITAATTTIDSAGIMLGPPGVYMPASWGPLAGAPVPPFTAFASTCVQIGL